MNILYDSKQSDGDAPNLEIGECGAVFITVTSLTVCKQMTDDNLIFCVT